MNRIIDDDELPTAHDHVVHQHEWVERPRRGGGGWLLALLAAAAIAIIAFFAFGGDADVEGDLEVPEVDVDAPQVDVDVTPADADAGTGD